MNQRTVGMGRDLYEENNLTYFQKSKFFSFQEYKLFAYLYHKLAISDQLPPPPSPPLFFFFLYCIQKERLISGQSRQIRDFKKTFNHIVEKLLAVE